ncbi:xylulokinase [Kocuria sp. cx-455]|uniref:xylulokinase n=1 Tax=Kocuria sp. cx-455 TaxID=2771377 RepID=UPI001688FE75|nr:xylulokinase [Kocuria sp. cx-455]MBD2765189.1 xylulokinase [Kocuria sp. cx-455]
MSATVVGIDSSTQSCKVVVVDLESGTVLSTAAAPHPDGTSVDPHVWLEALKTAWREAGVAERGDVVGVSVAGQQHGMVAVDAQGAPVHDALLWNDVRSAPQAARMVSDYGVDWWMETVNMAPVSSMTLTKLAWLRENEPRAAARVQRVMLPHDWLTLHLSGEFVTDRSDASGTGYFNATDNQYRPELLQEYFGAVPQLPRVLAAHEPAGTLRAEWRGAGGTPAVVGAGAGDNAAAGLGLNLEPGEVTISVGTSGTVFACSAEPTIDRSGVTAGFADATGQHLPLLCTINAARVMTTTAQTLGADLDEFTRLATSGPSDAGGLTMLPYFDGERTPNLPGATGRLDGLTRASFTRENLARSAVLAVANSLADCLDILRDIHVDVERVLLIGGGAKSDALRSVLPDTLNLTVSVPRSAEYVALGAARQAAWAATGQQPDWPRVIDSELAPTGDTGVGDFRARYGALRRRYQDQLS